MILSFFPYRPYFLPAKTFNRTLHLHETFQRFVPYSHPTELTNRVEFYLPSAHAQSATLAKPKWRLPRIHAATLFAVQKL